MSSSDTSGLYAFTPLRYSVGQSAHSSCDCPRVSPVHGVLDPKLLSAWVLEDRQPVRVQLQLHKYIWDPATRGV